MRRTRQLSLKIQPKAYTPPTFDYATAYQPDLKKWRYFQQQRMDSINLAKVLRQSNDPVRARVLESDLKSAESQSFPTKHRWRVVPPQYENGVWYIDDILKHSNGMYGKKEYEEKSLKAEKIETANSTQEENNTLKKFRSYRVIEDGSDKINANDRQDLLYLPAAYLPNPQALYAEPGALNSANENNFNKQITLSTGGNQRDLDALNSLLGKNPTVQLNGLKQLLNSQSANVLPQTIDKENTPIVEVTHDITKLPKAPPNVETSFPNTAVKQSLNFGDQAVFQSHMILDENNVPIQPQALSLLQHQLDAQVQDRTKEMLAKAQEKAVEHVQSQYRALALAKAEAERAALAQIDAQNLEFEKAHAHSQPEALPLVQNIQPYEEKNTNDVQMSSPEQTREVVDQDKAGLDSASADANIQAQAYAQLVAQRIPTQPQDVGQETAAQEPIQSYDYPSTVPVNSLTVEKSQLEDSVTHTKLQALAYGKSAAEVYSQPNEDYQDHYMQSENTVGQTDSVYDGVSDVSIHRFNCTKGNLSCNVIWKILNSNKLHSIRRRDATQSNYDVYDYANDDYDYEDYVDSNITTHDDFNKKIVENSTFSNTTGNQTPVAEKLVATQLSDRRFLLDDNYDDKMVQLSEQIEDVLDRNHGENRRRFFPKKLHYHDRTYSANIPYHNHIFNKHPGVHHEVPGPRKAIVVPNLDHVKKLVAEKDGKEPTVIVINNSNDNHNHGANVKIGGEYCGKKKPNGRRRHIKRRNKYGKVERNVNKALAKLRHIIVKHDFNR